MLFLDFILLLMITVCVGYCWVLNQRIRELHNSRIEFARMIKELNISISTAESNVNKMSELSKTTNTEINQAISDGRELCTELNTLSQVAEDLSHKLMQNIKRSNNISNYEAAEVSYPISAKDGEKFAPEDLAPEPVSNSYTKQIKKFFSNIVSNNETDEALVTTTNYYDTLRKISTRK